MPKPAKLYGKDSQGIQITLREDTKGAALAYMDRLQDVEGFSDGVEDVDLDHNATGQLHFGGGFTRKDNTVETDAQELEPMKSKKEASHSQLESTYQQ